MEDAEEEVWEVFRGCVVEDIGPGVCWQVGDVLETEPDLSKFEEGRAGLYVLFIYHQGRDYVYLANFPTPLWITFSCSEVG